MITIPTCVCKCICDILYFNSTEKKQIMGTMWHKTQNKEGKIGNISHRGDFFMFIPHRKLDNFFYHTKCRTCFNITPSSTKSHSHINFFFTFTRWLLPITPIPKELFLHALVIVHHLTYHTSNENPFIISHVCGGTWRMTHCLCAFIVNITPEAEVLLKYHICRYLPLFSP